MHVHRGNVKKLQKCSLINKYYKFYLLCCRSWSLFNNFSFIYYLDFISCDWFWMRFSIVINGVFTADIYCCHEMSQNKKLPRQFVKHWKNLTTIQNNWSCWLLNKKGTGKRNEKKNIWNVKWSPLIFHADPD